MIDDASLSSMENYTESTGNTHAAEIIRNARRYLALRTAGVMVPGYDFVKFDWSLDAAADRMLEGGNENY